MFNNISNASPLPELLSKYPGASVVTKSTKKFDNYDLIYGPVSYLKTEDENEREGYAPSQVVDIQGQYQRTIFDHKKDDSALEIFSNIKAELLKKEFEILYSCEQKSCGDLQGWQLYLTTDIDGEIDHQYYLIAKHHRKQGGDWYISYYVNDIGAEPRSLVDIVRTGEFIFDNHVINSELLASKLDENGKVTLRGVFFDTGKATLKEQANRSLKEVFKVLSNNETLKLHVVGHTDNVGDFDFNMSLSNRRAAAVRQKLVDEFGINANRLKSYGVGSLSPALPNDSPMNRSMNRRVELVVQ